DALPISCAAGGVAHLGGGRACAADQRPDVRGARARTAAAMDFLSLCSSTDQRGWNAAVQLARTRRARGAILVLPRPERRAARGGPPLWPARERGRSEQRTRRAAVVLVAAPSTGGHQQLQLVKALRRMMVSCRRAPTETMKIGVAVSSSSAVR